MDYNKLLIEAEELGIAIKEIDLKEHDGLCIGNIIFINKNLNTINKCCVLAEEIGHYYLTVGNITNQENISNKKQELIARRWSNKKLVGILDIIRGYEYGAKNRFEMAEFLGVTETFLEECINYYKVKYGTCFVVDNYAIYFEPTLGIIKMFHKTNEIY